MAVLERAELDQAARLAGLAPPDAARAADLLVGAGVLDEAPLCFAHPLLRGAVYRDMAAADRVEAHGRSARLLAEAHANPARVAEHLLATAPTGDGWTVEQLRAAAWEATARGAPESAVAYLRRAWSEPPSAEAGAGLLLELGLAEFSAGQPGWHDELAEAVESAGDDTTRIAAALLFANALRWHERAAEAIEVCDRRRRPPRRQRRGRPFDVGGHGSRLRGGRCRHRAVDSRSSRRTAGVGHGAVGPAPMPGGGSVRGRAGQPAGRPSGRPGAPGHHRRHATAARARRPALVTRRRVSPPERRGNAALGGALRRSSGPGRRRRGRGPGFGQRDDPSRSVGPAGLARLAAR